MKLFLVSLSALTVLATPAWARSQGGPARHHHIVGTSPHHDAPGFPITAAKDSVRINAAGQVISQPVPVIEKERNFNARARRDLQAPQPTLPDAGATPQP